MRARVTALLVEPDGLHVVAFVPTCRPPGDPGDLHANGQVALVCARPPDERGCQVKGVFVDARDAREDERAVVVAQWERFRDKLAMIGLPRVATDAWVTWPCPGDSPPRAGALQSDAGPRRGREAHVSVTLESLASCWQGLIPATLYTCSLDGVPNAAYLSHVDYVDSRHVALSFQFFNKSHRNIAENPQALVRVIDPDTSQTWALRLRLVRSETSGPVFERMALRIEAIASYIGPEGHLQAAGGGHLRSAVDREGARRARARGGRRRAPRRGGRRSALHDAGSPGPVGAHPPGRRASTSCSTRYSPGLDEIFGFHHSMILVPSEEPNVLVTIASRGYPENGVGAEARDRRGHHRRRRRGPQADSHLGPAARHAVRVRGRRARTPVGTLPARAHSAAGAGAAREPARACRSSSAASWSACCASRARSRTGSTRRTRPPSKLLGSYLAIAIQNMQLHERDESAVEDPVSSATSAASGPSALAPASAAPALARHEVTYYEGDEIVMVDGDYLIRSLPARILWKLLTAHRPNGRDRVHESRAAARQVAQPARVEGQPGEPPPAAPAAPRSEVPGHPARADRAWPVRAGPRRRSPAGLPSLVVH